LAGIKFGDFGQNAVFLNLVIRSLNQKSPGVLRPGSTGFQDKFQHSYLHYNWHRNVLQTFSLHSYGFLVDHAY